MTPTPSLSRRAADRRRGGTLVFVAVFITVLFAFGAFSVDLGNALLQRKKIQEATDAAALATVVEWAQGRTPDAARVVAADFALTNGLRSGELVSVECGTWDHANRLFTGPLGALPPGSVPAVRVTARRRVDAPFWKVLSLGAADAMNPRVVAVAAVARARAAIGVLPWAVCDSFVPDRCLGITLQFNDSGDTNGCSDSGPLQGNFGQLTLPGGDGADFYRENIVHGYQQPLAVGDCVETDPGVSWGPTKQGLDERLDGVEPYSCSSTSAPPATARYAILPKTTSLDVSGKKLVCITGFYVLSLNAYDNSGKAVASTFVEGYGGVDVDPTLPPIPGELNGVVLVH